MCKIITCCNWSEVIGQTNPTSWQYYIYKVINTYTRQSKWITNKTVLWPKMLKSPLNRSSNRRGCPYTLPVSFGWLSFSRSKVEGRAPCTSPIEDATDVDEFWLETAVVSSGVFMKLLRKLSDVWEKDNIWSILHSTYKARALKRDRFRIF